MRSLIYTDARKADFITKKLENSLFFKKIPGILNIPRNSLPRTIQEKTLGIVSRSISGYNPTENKVL